MAYDKVSAVELLNRQLKSGDFMPVYLFYGSEDYLKDYYLKAISKKLVGKRDEFNTTEYTDMNFSLEDFLDSTGNLSFNAPHKIILIKNLDTEKMGAENRKAFIGALSNLEEGVTVFLYYDGMYIDDASYEIAARRKRGIQAFSETACVLEFKEQRMPELVKWAKKAFEASKIKIDDNTASYLVQTAGGNMVNLKTEIDKLSLVADGIVTKKDIDTIVSKSLESNVFEIARELLKGKSENAIKGINACRLAKEDPMAVMSNICTAFYEMTIIKSAHQSGITDVFKVISDFKLNSKKQGFLRDYMAMCGGLNLRFLSRSIELIEETDRMLKETRNEPWQMIEILCLNIASIR